VSQKNSIQAALAVAVGLGMLGALFFDLRTEAILQLLAGGVLVSYFVGLIYMKVGEGDA
jgi:hypothetical protein